MNIRDWVINYFKNDDALEFSEAGNIGNGIERYLNDYCDNKEPDEAELKVLADKARVFYFQYDMANRRVHDRRQGIAELLAGNIPYWLSNERPSIVKDVCKELGITQKELADRIGVAEQTVRGWSSGKEIPDWALKSFEMLIELEKNREVITLLKRLSDLIS